MKKIIFLLVIGLFLMSVNVYAAGDLVVNGQLRVGPTPWTNPKLYLDVPDKRYGLYVDVRDQGAGGYYGARYNVFVGGTSGTSNAYGSDMNVNLVTNGASLDTLVGGNYEIRLGSPSPTAINYYIANKIRFSRGGSNSANHTAYMVAGIYYDVASGGGLGKVTAQYYRGLYLGDNSVLFNGTSHAQIWLDKITGGTTNRGIVLNGDGAGADIVFGPTQNARIYSVGGELWVQDGGGATTQISPHDPETGEWIFYSKNVKTGKTVRVNMERLVKAVEKLTGEKFMVESLVEEK
jgi:hypothetical protein